MVSLYVSLLADIDENTPIEARLGIYYGLCRLGWSPKRAYKATGIEECAERILQERAKARGEDKE